MRNDSLDLKMWNIKLEIIDIDRCFLSAYSFQKRNQVLLNQTILSIPILYHLHKGHQNFLSLAM